MGIQNAVTMSLFLWVECIMFMMSWKKIISRVLFRVSKIVIFDGAGNDKESGTGVINDFKFIS